jgi:glutathione synthase/RimK-type ligase-like ATP-grasp enzyme
VRLLCITDPLTHTAGDATVALYNRLAEDRRFEFYHLEVSRVASDSELPVLRMTARRSFQEFRALAEHPTEPARFTDFDLVFSRADKPYPPAFLPTLIRHEGDTRFVARPSSVLECDVRTFYRSRLAHLLPPGLITRSIADACAFIRATGIVVAKRNRSYGGKGVARIRPEGASWALDRGAGDTRSLACLEDLVDSLFASDSEPFEFVRYLPNVTAGDRRVLVVEGEIYGAILRVASDGSWINNLTSGGKALPAEVTESDREVIEESYGMYHERGLYTLGYDFLQDDAGRWTLSEINASGNIGGYRSLEETSGLPVFDRLLDWLLDFGTRR